ncbi:MAG: HpcH/HpaI aldolase family protein [Peptococcaceae bacterium]
MYRNPLKAKVLNREKITGCIIQGALPAFIEMTALAGFDFVFIDTEHTSFSIRDCEVLIRTAEARNTIPLIRIFDKSPQTILHYMDIGAMGVIVPGVESGEEVKNVVNAVKYYPQGNRGLCPTTSAADFGMKATLKDYTKEANNETVVFGIIESKQAVENINDILSVEGLDGVLIGTTDLAQSLGCSGEYNHPEVNEMFEKVVQACLAKNITIGAVIREGEIPKKYFDLGVNMVILNLYSLISKELQRFIYAKEI